MIASFKSPIGLWISQSLAIYGISAGCSHKRLPACYIEYDLVSCITLCVTVCTCRVCKGVCIVFSQRDRSALR